MLKAMKELLICISIVKGNVNELEPKVKENVNELEPKVMIIRMKFEHQQKMAQIHGRNQAKVANIMLVDSNAFQCCPAMLGRRIVKNYSKFFPLFT